MGISLAMRFLGVGNSHGVADLGCSAAVLEAKQEPLLLIDCGPDTIAAFHQVYGDAPPSALFITHAHFDHVGGLEGLFYRLMTGPHREQQPHLYVPVELIPVLQRRIADYPNILAEGGANFWDAFQLVPVSGRFWLRDLLFSVFPVRHHEYGSAFGIALQGRFLYTGDTRPIPEIVNRFAARGELIFHDCAVTASPSHTAVAEIRREYKPEQWRRMVLYHYESAAAAAVIEREGFTAAHRGARYLLAKVVSASDEIGVAPLELPLPAAVARLDVN